ncbi:MAG: heterodisulfide reductase-related iron-sulfur binding cluster [Armatimonadota bacterium]|nr:heterodisulfide reductase-related iron-sulfur binding cluster [Armatimonadota bacterium]
MRQCIHCGLCLQACPTYAVLGTEADSPRGRIALMRAVAEGRIPPRGAFARHIALCLACRACETACPSGVQYGALVETSRALLAQAAPLGARALRRLVLEHLLARVDRLRLLARLAGLYQASGLQRLVRGLGLLSGRLAALEALLPPQVTPAAQTATAASGAFRGSVAFFHGCVQEAFLPQINRATVRVLVRNGFEVCIPPRQTCCGAPALHLGEEEVARRLARRNIDAFAADGAVAIVNNAGGCGAALKEYGRLLADDPAYAQRAREFASRVRDFSEFLVAHLHVPPAGEVRARAVYVDSCHLRHVQKVVRPPRDLLRIVPGIELVELQTPDHCCGSAGVYNILQPVAARTVLEAKMADLARVAPQLVVTTNTGCHLQLLVGVGRAGLQARVVHLAELLEESYAGGGEGG